MDKKFPKRNILAFEGRQILVDPILKRKPSVLRQKQDAHRSELTKSRPAKK
jgi:hypothetical protein